MLDAFNQLSLPEQLRSPLLTLVGAEPDDEAATFASLTWEMYQAEVVGAFTFEDGRPPSVFEKSRLLRFYKELIKLFADPSPSTAIAPPAAPPNIIVNLPETTDTFSMRDYIEQTSTERFSLLAESEITALRQRYITVTGSEPLPEERPSDEQLSALAHLLRNKKCGRVKAPFT